MFIDWWDEHPGFALVVFGILFVVGIALVFLFARLLINSLQKSADYSQPLTTLMLILGTISIVALIGALFTKNESAFTIAATGVGAFAGALSSGAQKVLAGTALPEQEAVFVAPIGAEIEELPMDEPITDDDETDNSEDED